MSGGRTPGHGAVDIGDVAVGRCVRVYSSLWARSSWRYDAAAAAASLSLITMVSGFSLRPAGRSMTRARA